MERSRNPGLEKMPITKSMANQGGALVLMGYEVSIQESSRCWVPGFIVNPVRASTPVASNGDAFPTEGDPSVEILENELSHPRDQMGGSHGTSHQGSLKSGDNNNDIYEGNIPSEAVNSIVGSARFEEAASVSAHIANQADNPGFGELFGAHQKRKRKPPIRSPSLSSKSSVNCEGGGGELGSRDPLGPGSGEQASKREHTLQNRDKELAGEDHLEDSGLLEIVSGSIPQFSKVNLNEFPAGLFF
ncbi:hypothetical protein L1987_45051 [Smallanthus sonchifolius]|uniref:Uncharacterized protein n=1 Tax=Smallanthus sonchifolius TaxID=185202 RepID=A0ACB9GR10_9ASTR|nr:hypothetical protein L1987_45051 [Smallanthus sonchifolius]